MKAALDVFYSGRRAHAACVTFESWVDGEALQTYRVSVPAIRPYRPGRFFERELPPLLAVLEEPGEDHALSSLRRLSRRSSSFQRSGKSDSWIACVSPFHA